MCALQMIYLCTLTECRPRRLRHSGMDFQWQFWVVAVAYGNALEYNSSFPAECVITRRHTNGHDEISPLGWLCHPGRHERVILISVSCYFMLHEQLPPAQAASTRCLIKVSLDCAKPMWILRVFKRRGSGAMKICTNMLWQVIKLRKT